MLPPAPAAVAAYFERRRRTLAEFTPDDIEHNERLWLETCGVAAPPAPEAQNGGSTVPEVIHRSPTALTPHVEAVGSPSGHAGSGPSIARKPVSNGQSDLVEGSLHETDAGQNQAVGAARLPGAPDAENTWPVPTAFGPA